MKNDKLLNVLNGMELLDWSCACGECEYVLVEDNEKNCIALLEAGLTIEEIEQYSCEGAIDISLIAWEKNRCKLLEQRKRILH